jgi:predicted RNA polymerase sigma factor
MGLMIKVIRIFGIAIVKGNDCELERVAGLNAIEMLEDDKLLHVTRGDKLVQVKQSHHVHANPGTFKDKQTMKLPLESEDEKNG